MQLLFIFFVLTNPHVTHVSSLSLVVLQRLDRAAETPPALTLSELPPNMLLWWALIRVVDAHQLEKNE